MAEEGFGNVCHAGPTPEKSHNQGCEQMPWTVFNKYGQRKYLTASEVDAFVESSGKFDVGIKAFSMMLAYTGCRISEALALTTDSIDFEAQHIVFKCLKKRGKLVFRAVPVPSAYLRLLARWIATRSSKHAPLWSWSRMTAYRRICDVMRSAKVDGSYATPKGLRHAFGVRAIQAGVPLTLVQRWLGHADIKTTAIYTSAMGDEERQIAARMWRTKSIWSEPAADQREIDRHDVDDDQEGCNDRHQPPPYRAPSGRKRVFAREIAVNGLHKITANKLLPLSFGGISKILSCSLLQNWINRPSLIGNGPMGYEVGNGRRGAQSAG